MTSVWWPTPGCCCRPRWPSISGLRELFDAHVDLGDAPGRANVGHKAMTLIHSALAGGDSIDDADALRAGATEAVLGHAVLAPSTLGTFLRSFTWGHARQLDQVAGELLARAWAAGGRARRRSRSPSMSTRRSARPTGWRSRAGPFTYNHVRGYHPLLAVVGRHRRRGALPPAGRQRPRRPGSGRLPDRDVQPGPRRGRHGAADACGPTRVSTAATSSPPAATPTCASRSPPSHKGACTRPSRPSTSPPGRRSRTSSTAPTWPRPPTGPSATKAGRLGSSCAGCGPPRAASWPCSPSSPTTPSSPTAPATPLELEADHRRHAEIENTIRDLKYGVGLNHLPSGRFGANAAWLALNVIAHNLARWTSRIGLGRKRSPPTPYAAATWPPGTLTRSARRFTLHLPARWPWARAVPCSPHSSPRRRACDLNRRLDVAPSTARPPSALIPRNSDSTRA